LQNEKLSENAEQLGKILLEELKSIRHKKIKTVRGKGLFCAHGHR
jgi:4-aminobutyrate aminotransferase-like enzyme